MEETWLPRQVKAACTHLVVRVPSLASLEVKHWDRNRRILVCMEASVDDRGEPDDDDDDDDDDDEGKDMDEKDIFTIVSNTSISSRS